MLSLVLDLLPGGVTVEVTLRSWGRIVVGSTTTATLARGHDGSEARRIDTQAGILFGLFFQRQRAYAQAVDATGRGWRLEEDGQVTVLEGARRWDAEPRQTHATDCEDVARPFGGTPRNGGGGSIAGHRVVEYSASGAYWTWTAYFAPDLNCLPLRFVERSSTWGVPTSIDWLEVTSVRRGEPDAALMRPPPPTR